MHDPNIESYEAFIERMAGADLPKEDTVRSHLEAQKQLAYDAESGKTLVWGDSPDAYFHALDRILRAIQEHAVAALAILDNAPLYAPRLANPLTPLTMREIYEAGRDDHGWPTTQTRYDPSYCKACRGEWPCPDYKRYVAALAILDNAEYTASGIRFYAINPQTGYRLVNDPESASPGVNGEPTTAQGASTDVAPSPARIGAPMSTSEDAGVRLVPDPVLVVSRDDDGATA